MQKKDRKKKQEFHKHKLKFTGEEHLDFEQLKSRVSIALDKLGHQMFSLEPGGYTFHNWMTSFNLLLDDFEERARGHLSKEYYDSRLRLTVELVKPVDTSDIDPDIEKIEAEINATKLEMTELTRESNSRTDERRHIGSEVDHLKAQMISKQKELADASESLLALKKKKSFFSRLISNRRESSIESAKEKIESIQAEIYSTGIKIKELDVKDIDNNQVFDEKLETMNEKLDALQRRLADWSAKKNERLQLVEKRVETTTILSSIIVSLKVDDSKTGRNSVESE
ncbi:MAG: hypothetical protein JRN67_00715 [Nitrososphaerota archaeon]|nr:hypothetical protein [Nitrososphaerota archaeon]